MWKPPATVKALDSPTPAGSRRSRIDEGREHPAADHAELVLLRHVHRLTAAGGRVDDHDQPSEQDGRVGAPVQHGREDDRRRVNGDPRLQSALQEEQSRAQQAGLRVEPAAEVLVGRVHVEPPVHRQEHRRDQDQGKRGAEVVLDEPEAVLVALAGHREERHRAGLGGHYREADGGPPRAAVALQVVAQARPPARLPDAVGRDPDHAHDQDHEVEQAHEKTRSSTTRRATHVAKQPITNR